MFEWLEREISTIKTPRFHVVDGPPDAKLRAAVIQSNLPIPSSYKEFILKFGNAKLYRRAQNDSYRLGVLAAPKEEALSDGTCIYQIGFHDGARVYVKPATDLAEFPIFEFELDSKEKVADDFDEWLMASCAHARSAYGKEKWAEIMRGPEPFSPDEEEVVEARRQIRWRVLGIDPVGNHVFEVTNAGSRRLPALTVGVRSRNGRLNGAIRLKIGHIGPGETAVLHRECYKDLMPPHEIEAFALPDPRPEDRDRYGEFEST